MTNNGLDLMTIKSTEEYLSEIEDIFGLISKKIPQKSLAVVYLDYKVLIGTYENSSFQFYQKEKLDSKFIQRIRVFNDIQELHIWRTSDGLKGRLRTDGSGEEIEVIEANQILFGTDAENLGGYTKILEARGTELVLPGNYRADNKRNRVAIKTRNYIGYNDVSQAGYIDCRFVGFVQLN